MKQPLPPLFKTRCPHVGLFYEVHSGGDSIIMNKVQRELVGLSNS